MELSESYASCKLNYWIEGIFDPYAPFIPRKEDIPEIKCPPQRKDGIAYLD